MRLCSKALGVSALVLSLGGEARAAGVDVLAALKKFAGDLPLGPAAAALQKELQKSVKFQVKIDPKLTPKQLAARIQERTTSGLMDLSGEVTKAVKGLAPKREFPESYNFFTAEATRRCLFTGPMQQFAGTCWAHAAAAIASTAICKSEQEDPDHKTELGAWISPQQLVSCLDIDHPTPGIPKKGTEFSETATYGRGYTPYRGLRHFMLAGAPLADTSCVPTRACDFGKWGKNSKGHSPEKVTCLAEADRFPRCLHQGLPLCTSNGGPMERRNGLKEVAKITVYEDPKETAKEMQRHLLTYGPLAVAIDVPDDLAGLYGGGVYEAEAPKGGWTLGHAVVVSGWGVEKGKPYWLVMNSWGKDDGLQVTSEPMSSKNDGGFLKIARGSNTIGIESSVVYAVAGPNKDVGDLRLTALRRSNLPPPGGFDVPGRLAGDGAIDLEFPLPRDLLPSGGQQPKRALHGAYLRVSAGACASKAGLEVLVQDAGGAWTSLGRQACVGKTDAEFEVDVTSAVRPRLGAGALKNPTLTFRVRAADGYVQIRIPAVLIAADEVRRAALAVQKKVPLPGALTKPAAAPGPASFVAPASQTDPRLHFETTAPTA